MMKKILLWTPRVLCILAVLFIMMFSADCFDGGYQIKDLLICLFMHNIPALLIIAALIVAWNWPLIGGILLLLASCAGIIIFKGLNGNPWAFIFMAPFILSAGLFIFYHFIKKRQ